MDATLFTTILGIGAILIGVAIVVTIIGLAWYPDVLKAASQKYVFWDGFILSLLGLIGSLTYSGLFQFPPCPLCWWQRIFLYPQVILFGIGIWGRGDQRTILLGSSILSGLGLIVSIYQYLLQMGVWGDSSVCLGGTACASIDAIAFGFITIPLMCGILFLALLLGSFIAQKK